MADTKISNLTAIGTLGADDLFAVVDDPGGTPLSRKATGTDLHGFTKNPLTNDGQALGTGTLAWADLFLASGGIINWDNGTNLINGGSAALTVTAPNGLYFNTQVKPAGDNSIHIGLSGAGFASLWLSNGALINWADGIVTLGNSSTTLITSADDATNNAVTYVQKLTHTSNATPANNIGVGQQFEVETSANNNEIGVTFEAVATDASAASEDFTVRIKTMTAGQAAATSLQFSLPGTVYPQGHIFGLTMSNDGGDTTNDIAIAAGECMDETGVWNMTLSALTKRIDATWVVGTAQGGMANNGTAVADSNWYEVLVIGREDTRVVDVAFSLTANRATLPTSYTHKRRIGWVRRGVGTNLQFTQIDDHITLTTQINDSSTSLTATAAAITLTAPPSSIVRFRASILITALAQLAEVVTVFSEIVEGNVTPAGSTGIASLGVGATNATSASNDFTTAGHFELRVSSTSTIEHDSALGGGAAGTFDISTFGWIDHRRRMSAT